MKTLKHRITLSPANSALITHLTPYLPEGLAPVAANWIKRKNITLIITPPRRSLMGDFRPGNKNISSTISVSSNLNQYAFLITFVHEFAHLAVWEKFKHKASPHGDVWQYAFKQLLTKFLAHPVFPTDVEHALKKHIERPSSSTCYDKTLYRILMKYDDLQKITIEQILPGHKFADDRGRIYIRGHKLRTRYICTLQSTGQIYYFPELYPVHIMPDAL